MTYVMQILFYDQDFPFIIEVVFYITLKYKL